MKHFLTALITLLFMSVPDFGTVARSAVTELGLTPQEAEFLQTHRTLRVHSEKGWIPYNFSEGGKPAGYINDYMKLLAEKLGITLEYVSGKEWAEYLRMLRNGQIDIICNLPHTQEYKALALLSDKPVADVAMAILTKKEHTRLSDLANLQHKKLAVTRDFFFTKERKNDYATQLKNSYPDIALIYKNSLKEMITLVAQGKADAAISTHGLFAYALKKEPVEGLVSTPLLHNRQIRSTRYHLGVRKEWPLLKSALDKAMKSVTATELQMLRNRWLAPIHAPETQAPAAEKEKKAPRPQKSAAPKAQPVPDTPQKRAVAPRQEKPTALAEPKAAVQAPTLVVEKPADDIATAEEPATTPPVEEAPLPSVKTHEPDRSAQEIRKKPRKESIDPTLLKTVTALAVLSSLLLLLGYRSAKKSCLRLQQENEKLKNSQSSAAETAKAKDDYLAHISHEIRTPLNAILGMSTLTLQTDLESQQYMHVSKIHNSADMLLGLVNQILDFSKLEAGQMPLEKKAFNLNSVFEHLSDIVYVKADEKGLDVIFDVDHEVPVNLVGDPMRINQVLANLVTNALKFTEKGEITILAKKISMNDQEAVLEFTVEDTGIGIKKEHLPKLFNDYSQAEASTSRLYGGTGLGLVISKKLINQMGGDIQVQSEYGKGTRFIFTLCLRLPSGHELRKYHLPTKESLQKRMLILDASATSSSALYKKLDYFHFDIVACPTWEEAKKALDETTQAFDVIFVNTKTMAKKLLDAIVQNLSRQPSRIVFIAYNQSALSKEQIRMINAPVFLERPYSHQRLFNLLLEMEQGAKERQNSLQKYKRSLKTLSGSRIILAEDNKINQSIIQGMLEGTGIELTMADNGLEVLKILHRRHDFDLILMDINMPMMGGYEAAKVIRKEAELEHIPIIALTASLLDDDIRKSKEAGMNAHLGKPINIEEFTDTLVNFIRLPRRDDQRPEAEAPPEEPSAKTVTLDVAEGIERVGDDPEFFRSILNDFISEYAHSGDTLEALLKRGESHKAKEVVHDIKGISANISAKRLYEATLSLETALIEGKEEEIEAYLKIYKKEVERVIGEIDAFLLRHD